MTSDFRRLTSLTFDDKAALKSRFQVLTSNVKFEDFISDVARSVFEMRILIHSCCEV